MPWIRRRGRVMRRRSERTSAVGLGWGGIVGRGLKFGGDGKKGGRRKEGREGMVSSRVGGKTIEGEGNVEGK